MFSKQASPHTPWHGPIVTLRGRAPGKASRLASPRFARLRLRLAGYASRADELRRKRRSVKLIRLPCKRAGCVQMHTAAPRVGCKVPDAGRFTLGIRFKRPARHAVKRAALPIMKTPRPSEKCNVTGDHGVVFNKVVHAAGQRRERLSFLSGVDQSFGFAHKLTLSFGERSLAIVPNQRPS